MSYLHSLSKQDKLCLRSYFRMVVVLSAGRHLLLHRKYLKRYLRCNNEQQLLMMAVKKVVLLRFIT